MQAWKKTASYIRYHNWFSDTLDLDLTAVNLPQFLASVRKRLSSPPWRTDALRLVPAPKRQRWQASSDSEDWKPTQGTNTATQLRPLAHVGLADQVLATAVMLCLADRIETLQGDPRSSITDQASRQRVISYGNRLFCDIDATTGDLRHRWGSTKLYRAYFQDYRKFLQRAEPPAKLLSEAAPDRVFVVHADIRQFYDRVRPASLSAALDRVRRDGDDPGFFDLVASIFDWHWHPHDEQAVSLHARRTRLTNFRRIALPQGLVASGFFANVVLLSFDDRLREAIGTRLSPGLRLLDACRYVDDLRLTVAATGPEKDNSTVARVKKVTKTWLQSLLTQETVGLALSPQKMKVVALGTEDAPLVRQGSRMWRIQTAVSGGFDMVAGEEILDGIQSLMRAQEAFTVGAEPSWRLSPLVDVADETVARFAAARFRTTFRSIRPLLADADEQRPSAPGTRAGTEPVRVSRSQPELDEDARVFALGLIQRWVHDPSNVRLLRIGLDLWPAVEVLEAILQLFRPYTEGGEAHGSPEELVAWYCLSEVLRAGATETGYVADGECLPGTVNVTAYRDALSAEAARLVQLPAARLPWYLRQQALLVLAVHRPDVGGDDPNGNIETRDYWKLIRFLRGDGIGRRDFGPFAVVARRSLLDQVSAVRLALQGITRLAARQIAARDPSFLLELIEAEEGVGDHLTPRARDDLGMSVKKAPVRFEVLADVVAAEHPVGPLRNELGLLRFAVAFLHEWKRSAPQPAVITPGRVHLRRTDDDGVSRVDGVRILRSRVSANGSLYETPEWCESRGRWRFHLGFLLRFILSGQADFTRTIRVPYWKEGTSRYRAVASHWHARVYGLYSGQGAFGDDWLPITDWMEKLLLALLRWPGCRAPDGFGWVEKGIEACVDGIEKRIGHLDWARGRNTNTLYLPFEASRPAKMGARRSLYGCVVQTVVPTPGHFVADVTVSQQASRRRHRRHLSAALAAVERMLALRGTHERNGERLDWLILPELAVHPNDVRTHLEPFARAHKTMILAGLTYEAVAAGGGLYNSAIWIIPEWSRAGAFRPRILRQGKEHLAPEERWLTGVRGFRPCQWLVGYPWSPEPDARPIWLTAAVCYDATDLGLTAELRDRTDVFAIPALNKDVGTFDQMSQALHYHMFQLVVVVNNGLYGGSSAYWPKRQSFERQIFHTHGQPQASVAFFSIEDIADFVDRASGQPGARRKQWKYPPAGAQVLGS